MVWSLGLDGTPFVTQRLAPIAGDAVSGGVGINELGEDVSASGPCTSIGSGIGAHAVLLKQGHAIDLGNLGGAMNNIVFAINSQGQIVRISDLPGDNVTYAFLWERGAMKDLGTLRSDDTFSFGSFINDTGEVVGFSCGPIDCRGFVWQGGVMTDLNSVLPVDSPLFITNAADIGSRGEIAVQAFDQKLQDFVAAVLTPNGNDDGPFGDNAERNNVQRKVILPTNVRELLQRRWNLAAFKLSDETVAGSSAPVPTWRRQNDRGSVINPPTGRRQDICRLLLKGAKFGGSTELRVYGSACALVWTRRSLCIPRGTVPLMLQRRNSALRR